MLKLEFSLKLWSLIFYFSSFQRKMAAPSTTVFNDDDDDDDEDFEEENTGKFFWFTLIHAFFYKKVVYKKVYIKWPKIKKVLIYNIQHPKEFHKKVHKKGLYMKTHVRQRIFKKCVDSIEKQNKSFMITSYIYIPIRNVYIIIKYSSMLYYICWFLS